MHLFRSRSPRTPIALLLTACLAACGESEPTPPSAGARTPKTASQATPEVEVTPGVGEYVSRPVERQITSLHRVANVGNLEMAQLLLQDGKDPNATLDDGLAPLHVASGAGHVEIVKLLIENGADPDLTQAAGATALHIAVSEGRVDVIEALLEGGANPNIQERTGGMTPMHAVALARLTSEERAAVARMLVAKGADVDTPQSNGKTALHRAVRHGHRELVAVLLEAEADTGAADGTGMQALHEASVREKTAAEDRVAVAVLLLDSGADIDAVTQEGSTPLHGACHFGRLELVTLFLDRGANTEIQGDRKSTPIHLAAFADHVEIVQLLVERGADIDAATEDNATPLAIAAYNENASLVEYLQSKGAQ